MANGLWIAANGSVIVLSLYPVSSVSQLEGATFWGRIVLGIPGYVENQLMIIWIIFSAINLFCTISLCIQPKNVFAMNLLIALCSILSISIGGGFILGSILGIVGGFAGAEWPKPVRETFIGRFLRALRLDSSLFKTVSVESKYLREAVFVLILVNVLSGLGYGIYSLNVANMANSAETMFRVLLLGELFLGTTIFSYPLIYISVALLKWFILGLLVYLIGVKLEGGKTEFDVVARTTAFAYAPIALQIFLPAMFSNQPVQWSSLVFLLTNIWMIFALIVGIRQALGVFIRKALGIVMLAGGIYWIIDYLIIVPFFEIPGAWFVLQPASFILTLLSIDVILSMLLGVFSSR